mmetsp:Transcript_30048/g.75265  ORF Transcript_30048/g.75265 Transcript_30048/m.75265 type:complete len:352 (-) Transcript_30048:385-1440(-)
MCRPRISSTMHSWVYRDMRRLRTIDSSWNVLSCSSAAGPVAGGPNIKNSSREIGVIPKAPRLHPPKHIMAARLCPAMRLCRTLSNPATWTSTRRHTRVLRSRTAVSDSQDDPCAGHPPWTTIMRPPSTHAAVRWRPAGGGHRTRASGWLDESAGARGSRHRHVSTHSTQGSMSATIRCSLSSKPPRITTSSPRLSRQYQGGAVGPRCSRFSPVVRSCVMNLSTYLSSSCSSPEPCSGRSAAAWSQRTVMAPAAGCGHPSVSRRVHAPPARSSSYTAPPASLNAFSWSFVCPPMRTARGAGRSRRSRVMVWWKQAGGGSPPASAAPHRTRRPSLDTRRRRTSLPPNTAREPS